MAKRKKTSDIIKMTNKERLELENTQLKLVMAQQEVQALMVRRQEIINRISKKHKVATKGWLIDIKEGVMAKPKVADGEAAG